MRIRAALAALCFAAAVPALAQSPWYGGLSGGQSRTSRDLVNNRESTITLGSDFQSTFDDKDTAWKAFAGYRFGPLVAVEVNYAKLGSHRTFTAFLGGDPPLPASIALERDLSGPGVDLLLFAPLGRDFEVFGRVGAFRARIEASAELDGNVVFVPGDPAERRRTTKQDETVLRYGVGAQWTIAPNAALRLEWERHADVGKPFAVGGTGTTGEADTDMVSLGVLFRF